jgi:radical SAM superfamily enzyme YgiQ (UPF0313 family)
MVIMDLLQFQKPARYIGREFNLNFVPPAHGVVRVCLCFPEIYEVGMSYLGFRIVHDLFRSQPGISCERCFLPGDDMREYLYREGKPLCSIETATPLADFDVIAFCVNCEPNLVNAVMMLRLAGIPVRSAGRTGPLIIAGGMNNPQPLADMLDVIFMGEFEASCESICEILKGHSSREARLEAFTGQPFCYIPSRQDVLPQRAYVEDLDAYSYPRNWVVPYIGTVFDRLQVEIQRGCPNHCKYCQARMVYQPYRERSVDAIMDQVVRGYEQTGYEEISLLGLSVVDYSHIDELLAALLPYCKDRRISLGIPSIRPVLKAMDIIKALSYARKPGLTFAVETADDDLRKSIGKYINMEHVKTMIREGVTMNYRTFKFYFMTGLPGEDDVHMDAIADLLEDVAFMVKRMKGFFPSITASVNCFMPKPYSIFANEQLIEETVYQRRIRLLLGRLARRKYIRILYSDYGQARLETMLAHGGRELLPVIESVAEKALCEQCNIMDASRWI